jgi:hypothetical protein
MAKGSNMTITRPRTQHYRYVNLHITEYGMTVTLNDEGRAELTYNEEQHPEWNDDTHFLELISDMLGNGWMALRPEQIGALTSCEIILSPDASLDEEGNLEFANEIYWHENYQVELATEKLKATGLFLRYAGDTERKTPA